MIDEETLRILPPLSPRLEALLACERSFVVGPGIVRACVMARAREALQEAQAGGALYSHPALAGLRRMPLVTGGGPLFSLFPRKR